MLVKVTQELIERHIKDLVDPCDCPIYHAVRAQVGPKPRVVVSTHYVHVNGKNIELPDDASGWQMAAFALDDDALPPPIEFEIESEYLDSLVLGS